MIVCVKFDPIFVDVVSLQVSKRSFSTSIATGLLLLAGVILLLGVYFYFAASNPNSGSFSDSVRYLFMADYYRGTPNALTVQMARESMFPPAFPFVLAVFGAGTEAITTAHTVTTLTLLLSCGMYFWWLSTQQLTVNEGLMALVLLLLLPGVFLHSLLIISEFLFLAMVLGSLAAMEKSRSADYWILIAAVLVGLSITTRTIGIALLPGLFLACRSLGYRKLILAAGLSLGPYVLWQLMRDSSLAGRGYVGVFSLYLEQFSLVEIFQNLGYQLQMIWQSWIRIFDRLLAFQVVVLHSLLLIIVAPVFVSRLVRLKYEAVFLLVYLGIILLWPFPKELERFMIMLVPIFLFYCLLFIKHAVRKFELSAISHMLKAGIFGVILISITPSLFGILHRYSMPAPEELNVHRFSKSWYEQASDSNTILTAQKFESLYQLLWAVDDHLSEDECVYTTARDIVTLYSRREGKNLPKDLYRNADDGYRLDITELDQCDYVLMIALQPVQVPAYVSMYPIQALGEHMDPVLYSSITHDGVEQVVAAFVEIVR